MCPYVIGFLLLLAVNGDKTDASERQTSSTSTDRYSFFDLELLQNLALKSDSRENIALSPLSIKILLAIVMEGMFGQASDEIRLALRLNPETAKDVIKSWITPFKDYQRDTAIELATHLFLSNKATVNPSFAKAVKETFLTEITRLDVSNSFTAANKINGWVNTKTHGMIPTLVTADQITAETQAFLASALYFKGVWKKRFEKEHTTARRFCKEKNVCMNAAFMQMTDTLNYAYIDTLDAEVVEIPYKDDRFKMLIIVPKGGIDSLARDIDKQLHPILEKMEEKEIQIQIPRFTVDFKQDLVSTLRFLYISEIFSPTANFSGVFHNSNSSVSISNVFHSTKIIVNEEGTEAASVTGAVFVPLMGKRVPTVIADKPFFFFIRDSISDVLLFAGRVSDPELFNPPADVNLLSAVELKGGSKRPDTTTVDPQSEEEDNYEKEVVDPAYEDLHDKVLGSLLVSAQSQRPYQNMKPGHPGHPNRAPTATYTTARPIRPTVTQPISIGQEVIQNSASSFDVADKVVGAGGPTNPPPLFRPTASAKRKQESRKTTFVVQDTTLLYEDIRYKPNVRVSWTTGSSKMRRSHHQDNISFNNYD